MRDQRKCSCRLCMLAKVYETRLHAHVVSPVPHFAHLTLEFVLNLLLDRKDVLHYLVGAVDKLPAVPVLFGCVCLLEQDRALFLTQSWLCDALWSIANLYQRHWLSISPKPPHKVEIHPRLKYPSRGPTGQ